MEVCKLNCNLVIDFDSTFIKLEALEELAAIALHKNPEKKAIIEKIKRITDLGMEGRISFPQSLKTRLKLFSSNKQHLENLIELLQDNITDSIRLNKDFFINNSPRIYIISGGFEDFIFPIVQNYGIEIDHVLANRFEFGKTGLIVGVDEGRLLAQENGKVEVVRSLRLGKPVCVVGDGWTDYEIKKQGAADYFCAFCENVKRDAVVEKSDHIAKNFDEVIHWVKSI